MGAYNWDFKFRLPEILPPNVYIGDWAAVYYTAYGIVQEMGDKDHRTEAVDKKLDKLSLVTNLTKDKALTIVGPPSEFVVFHTHPKHFATKFQPKMQSITMSHKCGSSNKFHVTIDK